MWVVYSICASVFWGLTYVFNERVYKKISVPFSLALSSLVVFILTLFISYFSGSIKNDFHEIITSRNLLLNIFLGIIFLLIAELFIGYSINAKNATLAGLIEISYPVFIAFFSFVINKESNLSLSTTIGGGLIFLGISVIYFLGK